jgi:CRP-like cAMP-binding protein
MRGTQTYFGEMSIVDEDATASAHVVADSVVEVQALLRHEFHTVVYNHPALELAINRAIGKSKYVELSEGGNGIVDRHVELQEVIVDMPLFSACLARVIKDVLSRLKPATFGEGEEILLKGDKGKGLFIISEGSCDVFVPDTRSGPDWAATNDDDDDDIHGFKGMELVRTLAEGDWFGELSLLTNEPVTANVIASEECTTHLLPIDDWEEIKRGASS